MILQIFFIVLGLIIGSFLNVCIYRLPKEESVVTPGSHCVKCNKPIKWFDNIPVLSFFILRGKCRGCKEKISKRYPLVESLSALVFSSYYNIFGLGIEMIFFSIFTSGLIVAAFSDWETRLIPDEVSLGILPLGIVFSFFNPVFQEAYSQNPLVVSLIGALTGALMIYLTGVLGKLVFKKEAMGFGDVKFMALIGAFLGYKLVILSYFIAPFFALSYGVYRKIRYKDDYLPYGPFLAIAAVFVLFFREKILDVIFYL
ncbi:MAG: prepilin peptidase [Candidatus Saelkia tenebricola]|nr:prepilin peptidase [Candidatus Saelkia tenebricola]